MKMRRRRKLASRFPRTNSAAWRDMLRLHQLVMKDWREYMEKRLLACFAHDVRA